MVGSGVAGGRARECAVGRRGERPALTRLRRLASCELAAEPDEPAQQWPRRYSLIEARPETGRTHQIRVHLSAIGHPIVGDATYGGTRKRVPGDLLPLLRLERPFLHALQLTFTHPTDGRRMQFEAPLAADLQAVLDDLLLRQPV